MQPTIYTLDQCTSLPATPRISLPAIHEISAPGSLTAIPENAPAYQQYLSSMHQPNSDTLDKCTSLPASLGINASAFQQYIRSMHQPTSNN